MKRKEKKRKGKRHMYLANLLDQRHIRMFSAAAQFPTNTYYPNFYKYIHSRRISATTKWTIIFT